MAADIKLDGEKVTIEGNILYAPENLVFGNKSLKTELFLKQHQIDWLMGVFEGLWTSVHGGGPGSQRPPIYEPPLAPVRQGQAEDSK